MIKFQYLVGIWILPKPSRKAPLLMGELADNGIEFKSKVLKLELKEARTRGKGFEKTR